MHLLVELPPAPDPDPYRDPIALAVVAEVAERGELASVGGVLSRSGVSAEAFYRRYTGLEDCAVEAYERLIAVYERRIGTAFNSQTDWRSSLRAAAYETADWMEEHPEVVDFGMTGVLKMKSELARVRREEVFVFCAGLIDLGRTEASAKAEGGESAAMFAVGSIIQLLTHRLRTNGPVEPHAIVPEMMFQVVRTYLGEEIAREELTLPRSLA